ncbi:hypothetical protein GF337_09310 [candidate division KSB1 bacterium]|nr:hypothetical protein [candidate division KSB1 bacterium]
MNSDLLKRLLHFLVHASIKGEYPKEITIAFEVFRKDNDFDPSDDGRVRSNIYKLRKKLESYYEHEGKTDPITLIIPKGSYHVEFVKRRKFKRKTSLPLFAFLILISFTFIFFILSIYQYQKIKFLEKYSLMDLLKHSFWKDFVQSPLPTILVVDDNYEYLENLENLPSGFNRSDSIKNESAKSKTIFSRSASNSKEYKSPGWNAITGAFRIGQIFHNSEIKITVQKASELQWEDLLNNNVIYLGSTHGLYILSNFFRTMHLKYQNPNKFLLTNDKSEILETYPTALFSDSDEYREGYIIVAKCQGPNNNAILLLVGNLEMTQIYTITKLSDLKFLNHLDNVLNEKYPKKPRYFEMLLKIKGLPYIGFDYEILHLDEVDPIYNMMETRSQK